MKKISIIIPAYGTEQYIERCLNSVLNQTYTNLEIIVVNDCSKGNMDSILDRYQKLDKRIIVVNHEKNMGLFHARISGSKVATGDYICFLDSDDYITRDYYRILVENIEHEKSDISFSTIVLEEENQKRSVYKLFDSNHEYLEGNKILTEYFKQKGLNYSWHVVWNKLYTMDLWNKCKVYYSKIKKHLIMTEDFAFSTVLMANAKKISYTKNAYYFYCTNQNASTSLIKMNIEKLEKNVDDLITSFSFVFDYMNETNVYKTYEKEYTYWKNLYFKMWYDRVLEFDSKKEEELNRKQNLIDKIEKISPSISKMILGNIHKFYRNVIPFNDSLEKLKNEIIDSKHEVISFDIFDTLITRPFYEPSDLFYFLNKKFREVFKSKGFIEFNKIRKESEWLCRNSIWQLKKYDEITLKEIYDYIGEHYNLDKEKLYTIMKYEEDLEVEFCKRRSTGYELYSLAKFIGKKVICTSDMYLDESIIKKILLNNNYYPDKLYLSSKLRKIKYNGTLYNYLIEDLKVFKENILHIGDNYESDYTKPKELGIDAIHFPKALDVFNNRFGNISSMYSGTFYKNMTSLYIDNYNYLEYLGNRISLALVANKFFDNPFVSFNDRTDFNSDPSMVGYFALGMHMFSLSKWLLDNTSEYDTLSFMARDGKLLYSVSDVLKSIYNKYPSFKYIYVSRKSLIPAMLFEKINFYKLIDYVRYDKTCPKDIFKLLEPLLTLSNNYKDILEKNGFLLDSIFVSREKFQEFITLLLKEFYDEKKHKEYVSMIKKYFDSNLVGKVANFDIGYSGQPEFILSNLCNKSIDTFFIHCNNETGFKNSLVGHYKLKTFYPYRPVFTGTLREYLMSDSCPSCIGYKKENDKIVPIFNESTEGDYYDNEVLRIIQEEALQFSKDFVSLFQDKIHDICFENYYMSLPFEYFLHISQYNDRIMFLGLDFDENVGEKLNLLEFWNEVLERNGNYNLAMNGNYLQEFHRNKVKGRSKFIKIVYYLFFDRVSLKEMFKTRFGNNSLFTKFLRKFYHVLQRIKNR